MRKKIGRFSKLILLIFLGFVYGFVLIRGLNESSRRSLQLRDDTDAADHVAIFVLITAVNPATQELTAQISFRPQGTLAEDEVTPAVDLRLLTNNVKGQQEFLFPKGIRMNRIETEVPLNGELNRYPLDRYETTLWIFMTTPSRKKQSKSLDIPEVEGRELQGDELAVGTNALQQSIPVPLKISLSASTPGLKFEGNISREGSLKITGIGLKIRRADNAIAVSILVMMLMSALALSLLAMVLRATTSGPRVDLVPLSLTISLIFGLPALRNVQPGVPPVGAFGDYVAFIWAEIIVGLSAIIIIWAWLLRSDEEP